jgi:hypothetical protein
LEYWNVGIMGKYYETRRTRCIVCRINHHPSFHNHGGTYEEAQKNQSFEGSLKEEKC